MANVQRFLKCFCAALQDTYAWGSQISWDNLMVVAVGGQSRKFDGSSIGPGRRFMCNKLVQPADGQHVPATGQQSNLVRSSQATSHTFAV